MMVASTAGPATKGIAIGTINGSLSVSDICVSFFEGKIILSDSRNKIIPPETKIAYC